MIYNKSRRKKLYTANFNVKLNLIISSITFLLGTSSIIVSVFSKINENYLFEFRYMTVNGTVFTTLISFIISVICIVELNTGRILELRRLYYFRLSAAVTESIIAAVIAMSFLPSVPDNPNLLSYDSFCMHVLIPILSIVSFLLNRAPVDEMHPLIRLNCAWLITVYSAVVITLIITGLIPPDKIPYSFMDFNTQPIWYIIFFGCFIYSFAYLLSVAYTSWNKRISFYWDNTEW